MVATIFNKCFDSGPLYYTFGDLREKKDPFLEELVANQETLLTFSEHHEIVMTDAVHKSSFFTEMMVTRNDNLQPYLKRVRTPRKKVTPNRQSKTFNNSPFGSTLKVPTHGGLHQLLFRGHTFTVARQFDSVRTSSCGYRKHW